MTSTVTPPAGTAGRPGTPHRRGHGLRRRAAPVPARAARGRRGGRPGPRGRPRDPLDQDHGEGVRARPGDPHDRPHDARGHGHRRARCARCARRRCVPTRPTRRARRSPRSASTTTWSGWPRTRCAAAAVKVAAVTTAFPSGRAALDVKLADTADAVARRRRRDRHGDRPRRVPVGPLPGGLRRDRRGAGGLRRRTGPRAPQGDPRDRRAADLRQRTPGVLAGDARPAPTSSRPPPARSSRPPRCRSRWSCSRPCATSARRPASRSA